MAKSKGPKRQRVDSVEFDADKNGAYITLFDKKGGIHSVEVWLEGKDKHITLAFKANKELWLSDREDSPGIHIPA